MLRLGSLSLVAMIGLAVTAAAQTPAARFRWTAGQTLEYRVEHVTSVSELIGTQKIETQTKLNLERRWQILAVEPSGAARLQMSLISLRMETKKPNGETFVFDSKKADAKTAELNKELMQFVGKAIATIRIDAQGRLLDAKVLDPTFGSAARLQADLPFKVVWPDEAPQTGQSWERSCKLVMEPPLGAGESYDAIQKYTVQGVEGNLMRIGLATSVKNPPEAAMDHIPLIPMTPSGTITFDAASGRMKKADLKCSGEVADHRPEGGKYTFSSTYVEELIEK